MSGVVALCICGREAIDACGSQALWLRSYIRTQLGYLDQLSCNQNVCSYGGMEYAPNGDLIFHLRPDSEWELRGWVLNYQAALGEAERTANSASVRTGLVRLRTKTCAGEPDGSYAFALDPDAMTQLFESCTNLGEREARLERIPRRRRHN